MSLLSEINTIIETLEIPVETGGFGNPAPDRYVVLTSALRMREGPGLDKIIRTIMLNGTNFDVPDGSERVEADGFFANMISAEQLLGRDF